MIDRYQQTKEKSVTHEQNREGKNHLPVNANVDRSITVTLTTHPKRVVDTFHLAAFTTDGAFTVTLTTVREGIAAVVAANLAIRVPDDLGVNVDSTFTIALAADSEAIVTTVDLELRRRNALEITTDDASTAGREQNGAIFNNGLGTTSTRAGRLVSVGRAGRFVLVRRSGRRKHGFVLFLPSFVYFCLFLGSITTRRLNND
mmetsp:Transcript_28943/g.69905  ORF Transcript_28943/g.69905 Transcript_28943/m.69905 type:complete len:202 (-) Transcript_28943:304-909(-)